MSICCVGADEGNSYESGSSQPSIEDKGEWRKKLCSLRVIEEIEGVAKVILRQVESWSNGQ